MQYGFDGMRRGDGDQVKFSASGFVTGGAEAWYLIVVGEDIQDPVLQGYEDGGCDPGEELSTVTGALSRRETTLDEILRLVAEDYLQNLREGSGRAWRDVPFEAFYAAVSDGVVEDTHYLPLLQEFLFSQVRLTDRVVWFAAQVTIPAGGSGHRHGGLHQGRQPQLRPAGHGIQGPQRLQPAAPGRQQSGLYRPDRRPHRRGGPVPLRRKPGPGGERADGGGLRPVRLAVAF